MRVPGGKLHVRVLLWHYDCFPSAPCLYRSEEPQCPGLTQEVGRYTTQLSRQMQVTIRQQMGYSAKRPVRITIQLHRTRLELLYTTRGAGLGGLGARMVTCTAPAPETDHHASERRTGWLWQRRRDAGCNQPTATQCLPSSMHTYKEMNNLWLASQRR